MVRLFWQGKRRGQRNGSWRRLYSDQRAGLHANHHRFEGNADGGVQKRGAEYFRDGADAADPAKNTAPVKAAYVPQGPQPPPPPPPATLDMVFFGYGMLPAGGPRQAFLKDAN